MSHIAINDALDRLEELKRNFTPAGSARAERVLAQLARRRFRDAASLIRFHEILLFMRAHPHSAAIVERTEEILATFYARVAQLEATEGADTSLLIRPEVSGIAGTTFASIWSYEIARHLAARHRARVEIDWDGYEAEPLLTPILKKLLPLFEDGAYAEYPPPYLRWIERAKERGESDLAWLLRGFARMEISERERGDLFDALKLWIRWELGNTRATRTLMRGRAGKIFYHDRPLLKRSDVSLERELLDATPLRLKKLSRAEGERLMSTGRDVMTVRCRELHGFTYGDARQISRSRQGRGVEFLIWGVAPERRLPLLAYHSVLIFKNGVPLGYAEALSLFERAEVGLNLFYTFRDGESAWIYARLLRLFRQHLGIKVFSIEPYQLGYKNEEGIEAGALWFYRKLGFRPLLPELVELVAREERRIAARSGYRTRPGVLRLLAAGHALYESPDAPYPGAWDNFLIRHLGFAVQKRMSERFDGDAQKFRRDAVARVARAININLSDWSERERRILDDFAPVLSVITNLSRWSEDEKHALARILQAKVSADETLYLRLMQNHPTLRREIIALGSPRNN